MAKKKEEAEYSVILDTSFMIRLLSASDKLHPNALGYFRYFLERIFLQSLLQNTV